MTIYEDLLALLAEEGVDTDTNEWDLLLGRVSTLEYYSCEGLGGHEWFPAIFSDRRSLKCARCGAMTLQESGPKIVVTGRGASRKKKPDSGDLPWGETDD